MLGLFTALTHYHSESMECLLHTNEQHYAQNDEVFCPSCTLVSTDTFPSSDFQVFLSFDDGNLTSRTDIYSEDDVEFRKSPRAPPFMV